MGKVKVTTEKCVEAYLQTGSMRKAAKILGVSHSAVALHLEEYKKEKGENLVEKIHQKPMSVEVLKQRAESNIADLEFILGILAQYGEDGELRKRVRALM